MIENKPINVEFTEEMCPHCDILVEIPAYMGIYECPHCHKLIVSCSMCDKQNCNNCKFTIDEQLTRKTQECDKYKLENKKLKQSLCFEEGCKNIIIRERDELKAEVQKLKKQHESDKGLITSTGKLNHKLLQELEIWKNQVLYLNRESVAVEITQEQFEEYNKLKVEYEELKKQIIDTNGLRVDAVRAKKKAKIYLQKLERIKEIAETAVKCRYTTKSDDYTDGYRWLGSIILQKISECEVEKC